jgi:hypothetical protein
MVSVTLIGDFFLWRRSEGSEISKCGLSSFHPPNITFLLDGSKSPDGHQFQSKMNQIRYLFSCKKLQHDKSLQDTHRRFHARQNVNRRDVFLGPATFSYPLLAEMTTVDLSSAPLLHIRNALVIFTLNIITNLPCTSRGSRNRSGCPKQGALKGTIGTLPNSHQTQCFL